jgi:hypothetical protein
VAVATTSAAHCHAPPVVRSCCPLTFVSTDLRVH